MMIPETYDDPYYEYVYESYRLIYSTLRLVIMSSPSLGPTGWQKDMYSRL